jgi:hypothetical protein
MSSILICIEALRQGLKQLEKDQFPSFSMVVTSGKSASLIIWAFEMQRINGICTTS